MTASANNAPTVANPIDDQTAMVGTALNFAFPTTTFADTDGDMLTYTATKSDDTTLPAWLSFAAATRTFSGTPATADVGTVSVKVTASDGTDSVSDTFDIVVSAAADTTPPEVESVTVPTGSQVELAFNEDLDETVGATLPASVFSLTVAGRAVTIPVYTFQDETLFLYVQTDTIKQGQTVVVSYTDPTAADDTVALQDSAGNDVDSFTTGQSGVPAVTNNSTDTAPTGAPTITGTAQVGETLTAVTTGIADANGLTNVSYTYQWIRVDGGTEADIASTNSSTYDLVAADQGKTIKVKVSFTDDASHAETLTSAATATVVAAPTAPMVTDADVTSTPAAGDTYGTGEMIKFTVTFDQAVTVTGAPEFEFCLGTTSTMSCDVGTTPPARRRAALSSGSGTTALVFGYTVVVGDVDDHGIWIGNQDRTIKLEGGTIQGTVGGLNAVLTHAEEGEKTGHKVNGAAANTPPTTAEDRAYAFSAADFGFMDADAGAALASVKIVTLPALGTLALDGTAVTANDDVAKADIDDDKLTFTPVAGASSTTGYASFTFKVNDGTDDSASAYTMTIDVEVLPAITIAADRDKATGKIDWIHYTLSREGDTAAALTVTVTFVGSAGNDWGLDPTGSAKREVTFAADSATAEQSILVAVGFRSIGFSDSATMSGTLTARLGVKTGYDTSDTDEVDVVVPSGPAWVLKLAEDGGDQDIEVVATAASADMPAPSLDSSDNSVLTYSLSTTGDTASSAWTMHRSQQKAISRPRGDAAPMPTTCRSARRT